MNKPIIKILQYEPFLTIPGGPRSFKYYPTTKEIRKHNITIHYV